MSVSPNIIHIESPYLVRNLREKLQDREAEMIWDFRCIDPNDCASVARLQGHINGIAEAISILEEMIKKDGSKSQTS